MKNRLKYKAEPIAGIHTFLIHASSITKDENVVSLINLPPGFWAYPQSMTQRGEYLEVRLQLIAPPIVTVGDANT